MLRAAEEKFDLVIRGGEVLDPSQQLRARRDVGIRWGRIAAVEASIAPERAPQSIDASGKLVLPGLVDMHSHVYPQASALGLPTDELAPFTSTATYVSARVAGGDIGREQLLGAQALCDRAGALAYLRVRAHLEHRSGGLPGR